jgi:hypothetical protein
MITTITERESKLLVTLKTEQLKHKDLLWEVENLLAIIHRDGGQTTTCFGLNQSIAKAKQRFYAMIEELDRLNWKPEDE